MLVVTTENVVGHRVVEVMGQCFGVVVRSRGLGGNIITRCSHSLSRLSAVPLIFAPLPPGPDFARGGQLLRASRSSGDCSLGSLLTRRWREQDSNPRSLGPTPPYSMLLMHPEVGRPAIRVTAAESGQIRGNYTFILVSLSASMPLYEPRSQPQKLSTTAKLQSA